MRAIFGFKTLEEISGQRSRRLEAPIQAERRAKIRIAVIDDQEFEPRRNLEAFGYQIDEIGDIKTVQAVEDYPIVLCDLQDVGVSFDSVSQGAGLIREIRKNYPAKLVAAYSGQASSDILARRARFYADDFIQKDEEMEVWSERLDGLISRGSDPREVWYRVRESLVQERVGTKDLLYLEDAFVRSQDNSALDLSELLKVAESRSLGGDVRAILQNLAASAIFMILAA